MPASAIRRRRARHGGTAGGRGPTRRSSAFGNSAARTAGQGAAGNGLLAARRAGADRRLAVATRAGVRLRSDRRRRQHVAAALHAGTRLLPVPRQDHARSSMRARARPASRSASRSGRRAPRTATSTSATSSSTSIRSTCRVPLLRTRADAAEITLTVGFQGCQTDGICYPPMTRRGGSGAAGGTR